MPHKKLNSIQYLRAYAVLLVLYAHSVDLQMLYGTSKQQNFLYLQNFGAIGVDIFFVISGFIIAHIAGNKNGMKQSFIFIKKRFIRINPSYYVASFLFVLVKAVSTGSNIDMPKYRTLKTLTILPFFDSGSGFLTPFLHLGWTLSFEWFFYVLYAVLIFFAIKKKNTILFMLLAALTIIGVLLPLNEVHYKFVTNSIVWEFCFGVIISQLYKTATVSKNISYALLFIGLFFYALNIIGGYGNCSEAFYTFNAINSWQRVFLWGIPSAFIVVGMLLIEKNSIKSIFNNKVLLLIGDASYSVYLVHLTCFLLVKWFFTHSPSFSKIIPPDALIFVVLLSGVSMGVLYFKYVETFLIKIFNTAYTTRGRTSSTFKKISTGNGLIEETDN